MADSPEPNNNVQRTDPPRQDPNTNTTNTTENPSSDTTSAEASASNTAPEQAPTCAQCRKSPDSLKQCLKCHSVSYCNKDCQKAHFKTHKKVCASLAQEYVKSHEPKMASSSSTARGGARERGLQKWQFDT
ncbi:hypothetical protein GQ44DRAFT_708298 [Phaeosphaeriaceae sp. PMI808]|nr:hypothetical protein GQ44DRAFT_708298 [Phaeosphaeriaceae sp. PMI808]